MEMLQYLFMLLVAVLALAQSAFMPHLRVGGVYPDLLLVSVISWTILRGRRQGLIWALAGGIVLDLLSGAAFGIWTAALVGASLMVGVGAGGFFRSHGLLPLAGLLLGSLTYNGIALGLLAATGHRIVWADTMTRVVLPGLLVNLALMLLVFPAVRALHRATAPREMRW
jgi:rod shape-determining protein MreD